MSDRVVQSYHDGDGKAGQSVHPCQSVWMAHSTQTSYRAAPVHNCMSLHLENNDDPDSNKPHLLSGLEIASDISPSAKGFTEVPEAGTVGIMTGGLTTSKNMTNERSDCQPFPMFRPCRNISSATDLKNNQDIYCHRRTSQPQIDCNIEYKAHRTVSYFPPVLAASPPATETPPSERQSEGVSQIFEELVNSPKVVDGSLALAGPTQMVPYRFKRGKSPMLPSFTNRREEHNQLSSVFATKEHASNANFTTLGHEHDNYQGHSALLACEKKLDNHSTSVKSGTSFLRKSNACKLVQDPFAGIYHVPMLIGERCPKIQSCSSTGFFPSCTNPPEATRSERLYHGRYSLQNIAGSVHDVETMKICSTNPVEGLSGGPGAFSHTTHSLLFMKKTDVNPSQEKQTFGDSKLSAKLKGKVFGELSLSPPMGQNQQRLKLQHLVSSTESLGKDNVKGVQTSEFHLKNESSAETDSMDIDAFKEQNYLSGANSFPSNKDVLVGKKPPSQPSIASAGEEVGCRWSITRLADINEEIPVLPSTGSSMDNAEPSTSRTQSLDAEHLLSHTDQPNKTKSSPSLDDSPKIEPSSRWLKRLRLSASDSLALGTKSSNIGEPSFDEKVNKLFSRIMNGNKSSDSESMFHKHHGKEEMAKGQTAIVLRNGESSSKESAKKGQGILLSHPWIQRWCHNRAAIHWKKPEAAVVCEPQSTKVEFDELQNKHFPSIAAMALMGKAMRGFQPCEFRKRGSFVVWNTEGL